MSAPGITAIDHVSVLITDLAKTRWFYRDVLGLPEIPKPRTFDFVALWFDLGGGQTLHLLQKPQPDTRSPRRNTSSRASRAVRFSPGSGRVSRPSFSNTP